MPVQDAVISARVNPKLKRDSEKILRRLGLTKTEAIRMFLRQIQSRGTLPFSAKQAPTTNPTYPVPTTAIFISQ